ncbi:N-glycosidase YbiA [Diplonema papillatum]|nr:N-glycosidase YbiA [Diplonema papillatum]
MSRPGVIKFHEVNDVPYGVFSILSPHSIVARHEAYPSAYHYFLCQKFKGTEYEQTIRQAGSLWEIDRYVRRAEGLHRSDWDGVKIEVMLLAVYYKVKQNPEIHALLLSTGGKVIVNHTSSDHFWGDGGDGSGKNMMGVILMAVRKRITFEEKLRKKTEAQKSAHSPISSPAISSARKARPHTQETW